jgi:hypothetical protein
VIDDLRYSARALIRAPLFSAAVVLTLAVGIGANLAVFAVIDALIVRSLPYQAPDRLASVVYRTGEGKSSASVPSPAFLAWRASSRTAESMTAYSTGEMGWLLRSGEPVRYRLRSFRPTSSTFSGSRRSNWVDRFRRRIKPLARLLWW